MTRRSRSIATCSMFVACSACIAWLGGCHSRSIDATVHNSGVEAISPVEVDYPSASFGRETLAGNAAFRYRFKVIGAGAVKVIWTDAGKTEHTTTGPTLDESSEGTLQVDIDGPNARITYTSAPRP